MMVRKDSKMEDCFSSGMQNIHSQISSTPRSSCNGRRPSVPCRVKSNAAVFESKKLKKTHELRQGRTNAVKLPTLNFSRIQKNVADQEQIFPNLSQPFVLKEVGALDRGVQILTDRCGKESLVSGRKASLSERCQKDSPRSNVFAKYANSRTALCKADTSFVGDLKKWRQLSREFRFRQVEKTAKDLFFSQQALLSSPKAIHSGSSPSKNLDGNLTRRRLMTSREFSESNSIGIGNKENGVRLRTGRPEAAWQAKKLSLRLASSLEDALAKVESCASEAKKVSIPLGTTHDSVIVSSVSKIKTADALANPPLSLKFSCRDDLNTSDKIEKIIKEPNDASERQSRMQKEMRVTYNIAEPGISSMGCTGSSQTKTPKVKPSKLPLGNYGKSFAFGSGSDPVEHSQTARTFRSVFQFPSPRLAITERSSSHKFSIKKCGKSDVICPVLPLGVSETPEMVLKQCGRHMTRFEQREILTYTEVYYLGTQAQKVLASATPVACKSVYSYIQSRFYRSPEVILGLPYDTMIDVWSFGCILAELFSGHPLFPGENEVEQLACMMEILGLPPNLVLEQASRKKMFFDSNNRPKIVIHSWGRRYWPETKNIGAAIKCNDPVFVDFLECCLRWDKSERLTPEELLEHEWILEVGLLAFLS
ncbi:hypothetical protein O6H91_15G008200 [Diphasiastrum complanatum]|uniref:Uncharacterized protein n=1 Tax=Diphasiastrum complanatum TaxID=34168 RepID=A0ACC2BGK2_DIPCM|nr:hypothetical protein O6H91_15G008200 [Diphasiastrum complanatum]